MFKNKVIFGSIAGLAATLIKDGINQTLYSLKILKTLFAQYASGVFVKSIEAHSLLGIIFGYFADFVVSAVIGIVFLYSLEKTQPKYIIYQGMIFGLIAWVGIYGVFISLHITSVAARPLIEVILMFFIHLVYGFVLGLIVNKYWKALLICDCVIE